VVSTTYDKDLMEGWGSASGWEFTTAFPANSSRVR
jgi:hypothetical protein